MRYQEYSGDCLCNACRKNKAKWSTSTTKYCDTCKSGRERATKAKKNGKT